LPKLLPLPFLFYNIAISDASRCQFAAGWPNAKCEAALPIIHGPAHRGANGAAMPTDEDDQDGHFFFNHPERGGYPAA